MINNQILLVYFKNYSIKNFIYNITKIVSFDLDIVFKIKILEDQIIVKYLS